MHVGAEGVDSLNDRLINDLSVLVAVFAEHINLRHHARHVEASSRGVERDLVVYSSVRTRMLHALLQLLQALLQRDLV